MFVPPSSWSRPGLVLGKSREYRENIESGTPRRDTTQRKMYYFYRCYFLKREPQNDFGSSSSPSPPFKPMNLTSITSPSLIGRKLA